MPIRRIPGWILLTSLCIASAGSSARACPDDTVRIVIGYSAGGTGGIVANTLAEPLGKELGQKVVVDYLPGSSGGMAARSVSKAAADGCMLLLGQTPEIAINPVVSQNIGYDLVKDLRPVALVASVPLALVVSKSSPFTSVDVLVAASRSAQPALSFASAGRATPGYYAGELLRLRTRSPLAHVSYDGGGVALQAVTKGQVSLYFPAMSTAMEDAGRDAIRILAVASSQRVPAMPQVPTLEESGLAPFVSDIWLGFFAPGGTSVDTTTRLNKAINQVLLSSSVRTTLIDKGARLIPLSVAQFDDFVKSEQSRYKNFIDTEFCAQCPW